jgi:hypothetical protein
MKVAKYLVMLAFAFCAFTSITNAQTVQFLGAGSSAIFNELGSAVAPTASFSDANGPVNCFWSFGTTSTPGGTPYVAAHDARTGIGLDENGKIFIAWGPGGTGGTCAVPVAPYSIYAYISLDSTVGDRCFFINDGSGHTGCTFILQNTSGVAGTNQVSGVTDNATIPTGSSFVSTLTATHFFVAGTDIRPEDAKFATLRAFVPCTQLTPRQFFNQDSFYTFGTGNGTGGTNLGTAIAGNATFGGGSFNVVNFNITGNDPVTSQPVPASYAVNTIGAQPILIVVSPLTDGFVAQMKDITQWTLAQLLEGYLARTNDLLYMPGPQPQTAGEGLNVFHRENLSGTYNVLEFSIPNGTQFHGSQEVNNCNSGTGAPNTNPMNFTIAGISQHTRVIGTGNMLSALNGTSPGTPFLGYFFHSAGNDAKVPHGKYLLVNGIDPLLADNSYSHGGILPGSGGAYTSNSISYTDPGIANVTFAGLNAGDYPIWSPVRLVSASPVPTGVTNMLTALNNLTVLQNDYIKPNNMNIWHSHFFINNETIPTPANGATLGTQTLCSGGSAESGGDAGGETLLVLNNLHFCADYGSTQGKLNLTQ